MKAINAGELRHRIMFQTPTDAVDEFGAPVPTWSQAAIVWAKIEPLSGKELELLRSLGGTETHRVTCRYYPGIVADGLTRIAYPPPGQFSSAFSSAFNGGGAPSRLFTLNSVMDVEERHYVLILNVTENVRK